MNSPWSQQWRFTVALLVLLGISLVFVVFDPSCHRPPDADRTPLTDLLHRRPSARSPGHA